MSNPSGYSDEFERTTSGLGLWDSEDKIIRWLRADTMGGFMAAAADLIERAASERARYTELVEAVQAYLPRIGVDDEGNFDAVERRLFIALAALRSSESTPAPEATTP